VSTNLRSKANDFAVEISAVHRKGKEGILTLQYPVVVAAVHKVCHASRKSFLSVKC
jgi:hypothetical protein